MKISVLGNCQALGLGECMRVMAPQHEIAAVHLGVNPFDLVLGSDVIAIQSEFRAAIADHIAPLVEQGAKLLIWPTFNFPAFHPDLVYVRSGARPAQSPLMDYHSSIVFAAWQQNVAAAVVAELFCERVFEKLGFFNYWDESRQALLDDMAATGLDLGDAFQQWKQAGSFCFSPNHPKLVVIGSYATALLRALAIRPRTEQPGEVLHDWLRDSSVWPVYPEIGERLGIPGSYLFKPPAQDRDSAARLFELDEFIAGSYAAYDAAPADSLICDRLVTQAAKYADLRSVPRRTMPRSPYSGLPDFCYWRKAVAVPEWDAVDPVVKTKFALSGRDRIATAGSCFAQHIARTLLRSGYNYFVAEQPPADLPADRAAARHYGLFSARYGNIYTARQLVQTFDRAFGSFEPVDGVWERFDGQFIDPFRPQIEPDGFQSVDDLIADRKRHLAAVRELFRTLDIFVFTVGLTESWRARADGAVFPVAPGVVAAGVQEDAYEFVNFTAAEVEADLRSFVGRLRAINPLARVILTVSPVPLVATYERRHVLVSTTYSKSVLRVAAGQLASGYDNVDYFPSYEIITGHFNRGRYFEEDLREIRPEGVNRVMRLFKQHFFAPATAAPMNEQFGADFRREIAATAKILCDEELFDRSFPSKQGPR